MKKFIFIALNASILFCLGSEIYIGTKILGEKVIDRNLMFSSMALVVSVLALLLTVVLEASRYLISISDKRTGRKTIMITAIGNGSDLQKVVDYLYGNVTADNNFENEYNLNQKHGILKNKSIDKIEILNTTIGTNNNKKDIVVIFH